MADKDYYDILGVARDATRDDIKRAYKKLAKKYHPDINKEDPEAADRFKEINEAAAVLSDEQKRAQYDRFGTTEGFANSGGAQSGFDFSDFGGFGDIFESFFGGRRGPRRGSDLRFDIEITLEQVAKGAKTQVTIPKMDVCESCSGSGAKTPDDISTCPECDGRGQVTRAQRTPFGIFQSTATCPNCRGDGKVIKDFCTECRGEGKVRKKKKLDIDIPAGAPEGTRLRISGEGEAGEKGAPPGDLYIVVHVKEHDLFERDGDDLIISVPISFTQAALGDEISVPTIDKKARVKIPAGTQTGTAFRLRDMGLPHMRGHGKGDQLVVVEVQVPTKLNAKQKKVLEEFRTLSGEDATPSKSLFDKIKDIWD